MKTIDNFIQEKLKINSKSKIVNNWSIKTCQPGDIIAADNGMKYPELSLFIKYIQKDFIEIEAIITATDDDIKNRKIHVYPGYLNSEYGLREATLEEKKYFHDMLDKNGYKWDENKKHVIKK